MRLIDAEALENKINVKRRGKVLFEVGYNMAIDKSVEAIENAPTIETKPVVHAHWEQDGVWDICSHCKRPTLQPHIKGLPQNKYCPNCGAQMDGTDTNVGSKGVKIPGISMEDFPITLLDAQTKDLGMAGIIKEMEK